MVCLDSNTLTYLYDALDPNYDPLRDPHLGNEKTALIRIFFYRGIFYILPTVKQEYYKISDKNKRLDHDMMVCILLDEDTISMDIAKINVRKKQLLKHHVSANDCQILAEAENINCNVLLTCDDNFLNRLSPHSKGVLITKPSKFWETLCIPNGSKPVCFPAPSNPLSSKTWWLW